MRSNLVVIIITAVLFGLSFGIYDLVLPLWLKTNGINYVQMGWIFAISNGVMMVIPIVSGWLADHFGRKRFFAAGLGFCAAACAATPLTVHVGMQTMLRTVQRAASGVYESLQGVLLFESNRVKFVSSIRFARGFEFTCRAFGAFLVWILITGGTASDKLALPLYTACGLLVVAFVLVGARLREPDAEIADPLEEGLLRSFGLPRVLILLAAFNFIFMLGLLISHSQMMLLFFYDKFQLAEHEVAWVSMAHRLSLGLPMMLAGFWIVRPHRLLFATTVVLEGMFISATVLPSGIVGAVTLWLLHDPIGAAIWVPMNAWYIQHYSRPQRRAADVATVMAMSTLGMTIGPIIAGALAEYEGPLPPFLSGAIDLPFLASGLMVAISAVLVCFFPNPNADCRMPNSE